MSIRVGRGLVFVIELHRLLRETTLWGQWRERTQSKGPNTLGSDTHIRDRAVRETLNDLWSCKGERSANWNKTTIQKCMLHKQSIKWVQRGCVFLPGDIRPPQFVVCTRGLLTCFCVTHRRSRAPLGAFSSLGSWWWVWMCQPAGGWKGIVCAYLPHWPICHPLMCREA